MKLARDAAHLLRWPVKTLGGRRSLLRFNRPTRPRPGVVNRGRGNRVRINYAPAIRIRFLLICHASKTRRLPSSKSTTSR